MPKMIDESSGLAAADQWRRLYHINDSGDGPFFYLTDLDGRHATKVTAEGFRPVDAEDLGRGPCMNGKTCLFFADIGDNRERRKEIQIAVIEELKNYPAKVKPVAIIKLKYPDRAHNAEALAVHPNGDLFLLTKEFDFKTGKTRAAKIFRVEKSKLQAPPRTPLVLGVWGEIDVAALAGTDGHGALVTALDISLSGDRFLVLTYGRAYEFDWDLSKPIPAEKKWTRGKDVNAIELKSLLQQESIAYVNHGNAFVYTSESHAAILFWKDAVMPIMRVDCKD